MTQAAVLALEDGSLFHGRSIGISGQTSGEVVFNTAITGYQEILTDPSYARQIVTLTQPHIGVVGCNRADEESSAVMAAGLIVRALSPGSSNWRSEQDLQGYLKDQGIVAIADIDTRRLTRILRDKGAQNGCIYADAPADTAEVLRIAREFPGLKGMDLASVVTTDKSYEWQQGTWKPGNAGDTPGRPGKSWHVVAYDFGIKRNILRILSDLGCRLTVVPATTPAEDAMALQPDGIFLSNGPGDPDPCDYAIEAIRQFLSLGIPLYGICLGYQLLALALGAGTVKMKCGHHGANHPVQEIEPGRVLITSQNHGFAVDESSLPADVQVTHRSLFDDTLQGIHHDSLPAFGFQGHPEASPGPHDVRPLFDHFIELMKVTTT